MRSPRAVLVAFLVASATLAGCFGKEEPPAQPVGQATTNNSTLENATLPDGRGVSAGNIETNKTEDGFGGVEHKHDYWKGQDNVVVCCENLTYFQAFPVYPDGEGSNPGSIAYIKLPQPNLVYEGAVSLDVKIEPLMTCFGFTPDESDCTLVPDPSPPALTLRYRSAADTKFRDVGAITPDAPVKINIQPKETDMPHSVSSLWAFAIIADKPVADVTKVTITVHRGANVVDWPGHPDFYADKDFRVVLDKDFKVHRSGAEEGLLYGAGSTWQAPDKLISYGTGRLDIYVNITKAQAANGAQPTDFILEYHNATILDAEDVYNARLWDTDGHPNFQYNFSVEVHPAGMDGPYQPSSLWGFRPVAFFGNAQTPEDTPIVGAAGAGLCPGCFPYDIEYHMTIIAHKGSAEAARLNG